jgi:hypothetical protein
VSTLLLTTAPVVALGGCATTTGTGAGPGNTYLIVMAGFTIVFVVTMKSTAIMAAALADLMVIVRRLVTAVVMFASAAAVTGVGLALVAWVTLN